MGKVARVTVAMALTAAAVPWLFVTGAYVLPIEAGGEGLAILAFWCLLFCAPAWMVSFVLAIISLCLREKSALWALATSAGAAGMLFLAVFLIAAKTRGLKFTEDNAEQPAIVLPLAV